MNAARMLVAVYLAVLLITGDNVQAAWLAGNRDYAVATPNTLAVIDGLSGTVKAAFPRQLPFRPPVPQSPQPPLDQRIADEEILLSPNGTRLIHHQGGRIQVWNIQTGRLEWQGEGATPLGLFGKDGERLALLSRRGNRDTEFAILNLSTGETVLRRSFHLPAKYVPLSGGLPRFAAFTFKQRELWLWDDAQGKLRQLVLPERFFIMPPLVVKDDGTLLAVSGTIEARGKTGGEILVFDTRTWKLVHTYANDDQANPQALGWSPDGGLLLGVHRNQEFVQFDAASGRKLHQWHYAVLPHIESRQGALGRKHLTLKGPEVLAGANALASGGGKLLFWDRYRQQIIVWDVSVSPPRELPPLCANEACGTKLLDPQHLEVAPAGHALMLQREGKLWRVDTESGGVAQPAVDAAKMLAEAEKATEPELRMEDCSWRKRECLAFAEKLIRRSPPCRLGQPDTPGCRERKAALPWLQAACLSGDSNTCQSLAKLAADFGEPALSRLALAVRCHLMDPSGSGKSICRQVDTQPAMPGEWAALEARCKADAAECWISAATLEHIPGQGKKALAYAARGCEDQSRHACLAGGDIALAAEDGKAARGFFEQACALDEDKRCVQGAQQASRLTGADPAPPSRPAEPSRLCEQLAYGTVAGVQRFENGEFTGLRVTALSPAEGWPFHTGDLLLDTIQCAPAGGNCSDTAYFSKLASLCYLPADKLLHDVVVEVAPDGRKARRTLLLRQAPR